LADCVSQPLFKLLVEPELDSFQAARRFIQDLSTCGTFLLCSSVAGYLFFRSGQMLALDLKWMTFVLLGASFVALVGISNRSRWRIPITV